MEISHIRVEKLITLDRNPRTITRKELQELKASITADPDFMLSRPVLVNRVGDKHMVYAGTQRLRGYKELGYEEVPCFVQENIPTDVMERRMVLDNLHSGKWDFRGDILAEFTPIGSLVGERFHINAEQVVGFTVDSVLEPRSKTPTRNFFELTFESKADYDSFVGLLAQLKEKFPHISMAGRLIYFLREEYGGTGNKVEQSAGSRPKA